VSAPFRFCASLVNTFSPAHEEKKSAVEIPFTRRIHGRNMREIACAYLSDIMYAPKTLVVVGQGMVGYKLLECLADMERPTPGRSSPSGRAPPGI